MAVPTGRMSNEREVNGNDSHHSISYARLKCYQRVSISCVRQQAAAVSDETVSAMTDSITPKCLG